MKIKLPTDLAHDDAALTVFAVPLDDITTERLLFVAQLCRSTPVEIIAGIVRDVLEDDAQTHDGVLQQHRKLRNRNIN